MEDDRLTFASTDALIEELKARCDTCVVLIRLLSDPSKVFYHTSGEMLDICYLTADCQRDMIVKINEASDED